MPNLHLSLNDSGVSIASLERHDDPAVWDDFVGNHAQGSIYHRSVWREIIARLYGHQSMYLCAKAGRTGEVMGVLPLIRLRSALFGDYLVSMPYFNYGGALAETPEIAELLMLEAGARAKDLGATHIEFRDTVERSARWPVRKDKVVMELALPDSPEVLWKNIGSKLRAQIKRPQRETVSTVQGGVEVLDEFYAVFSRNMRDLGTPVYAKAFFAEILAAFPHSSYVVVVRHQGRPAAAGFLLGYQGRLEIPWASSLREFNALGINMLMYWEVLRLAIERGYAVFDFGRSTVDSGTYRFKKQWGAEARPLYWHYWLDAGRDMPRLNPGNPKYRMAIAMWQRLPLFVANKLGPLLVKNLP
jgi:FemAB-related protein (PEP-CTERM system-associated)